MTWRQLRSILCLVLAATVNAVGLAQADKNSSDRRYTAVVFENDEIKASEKLNQMVSEGWEYVGPLGNGLIAFRRSEVSASAVADANICPCSVWRSDDTPTEAASGDLAAVEVGVKFTVDRDGFVAAIRFYKAERNTGKHIGNLWGVDGELLATAVFANESLRGWQQVNFETPVPVTAGKIYVASYHAPNGRYAVESGRFSDAGIKSGPLKLLRDGAEGGNGVFIYSADTTFPVNSFGAANYWVDVVFTTDPAGMASEGNSVILVNDPKGIAPQTNAESARNVMSPTPAMAGEISDASNELASPVDSSQADVIANALDEIQGTWSLVSLERDGVKERSEGAEYTFSFTGTKFALVLSANFSQTGTIEFVDPIATPRKVNLTVTDGLGKGDIMTAIYTVEGNMLRYGIASHGAIRPIDFETTPGGRAYTTVWKRFVE